MKEPILSKDLQILQDILFAVSLSPLNSFFHSGINFLMQPVCSYHSRTASFSASVFFGGACNMLKFARNHFLFSSLPSSAILRSQPRIECMNGILSAKKSIIANQKVT